MNQEFLGSRSSTLRSSVRTPRKSTQALRIGCGLLTSYPHKLKELAIETTCGPPYRDYITGDMNPIDPQEQVRASGRSPAHGDHSGLMLISPVRDRDTWRALWQGDRPDAPIDSYEGDRESAIRWAQERCDEVLIYSEEFADYFPL